MNKFKILDKITPGLTRSLLWEILNAGLTFIASICINRSLGADDRGLFALVLLVPTTGIVIGACQWERTLQGLITCKKISGKEAWRRSVYYTLWLSVVFIPIGLIINILYSGLPSNIRIFNTAYFCTFPIYLLAAFIYSIYLAIGNIDAQYAMRTAMQISYLALIFTLLVFDCVSVSSLTIVYMILQIIYCIAGWIQKDKLLVGEELSGRPSFSPLIKGFFPNTIDTLSLNLDVWAFSGFGSLRTLGQYAAITSLMQPISLISNALSSGSTARLDWTNTLIIRRYLFRIVIVMLCLLSLVILGLMIIKSYLLELLLGKTFIDAWWMIPWTATVIVTKATGIQFITALRLSGLENSYLAVQSLEPMLRLILVLILGWQFSEFGIMLGMILSSVFKSSICFVLLRPVPIS